MASRPISMLVAPTGRHWKPHSNTCSAHYRTIQSLTDNLQGPVATYSSIGALVVGAIAWGWGQSHGEGTQRLAKLIFAIPCAVFAVKILTSLGMMGAIL